eukprot:evm.model.scf_1138.2 EVM.evm.TU.scf_1138.2   scf_1138:9405-15236(-)
MSSSRAEDYEVVDWAGGKLERAVLEIVVVAVWRLVASLGAPLGRLLAFFLWSGGCMVGMARGSARLLRRAARWLSASWAAPRLAGWSPWQLRRWHAAVGVVLAVSAVMAILRQLYERFDKSVRRRRAVMDRMAASESYEEWSKNALELRALGEAGGAKRAIRRQASLYASGLFHTKFEHLKKVYASGDIKEIITVLRADMVRKLGNMHDSEIYRYPEVPEPIRDYLDEVKRHLKFIVEGDIPNFGLRDRVSFLQEARHTFGRTALLLSGGGALGAFHLGVVKALLENKLLPRIVGGSSVGSIVSAIVGTHTDEQLAYLLGHLDKLDMNFLSNSTVRQFLAQLIAKGTLHDEIYLQAKLKELLGDLTFLEAYEHSGRVVNVVVCAADTNEPPRVLNYLTAPQVLVWSAVAASSAFPGLFPAQDIKAKNAKGELVSFSLQAAFGGERRWRDGSLEEDLPFRALREMFNVNYFLVSQTNPHIVPILNFKNRFNRKVAKIVEIEWKHRCQQLQNLLPDWIPSKWLTLFSQTWEGDVTMVLPAESYWTLVKAIVNPTPNEVVDATHRGEVSTWEKLAAIQVNCAIENALDECQNAVMAQVKGRHGLKGMKSRIPSWLHMPVLGMPTAESLDSLMSLDDSNAPHTPQRETDSSSDAHGRLECLDDTARNINGSVSYDQDSLGDKGLDVIAP